MGYIICKQHIFKTYMQPHTCNGYIYQYFSKLRRGGGEPGQVKQLPNYLQFVIVREGRITRKFVDREIFKPVDREIQLLNLPTSRPRNAKYVKV